jgi:hypothetical protein
MNTVSRSLLAAIGIAAFAQIASAQDHGHLNVGALGTNQGDQLFFANGADFSTDSRYIKTLTFTNAGQYAGYFQQNITLTVLPATLDRSGPDPDAPALGSYIFAQIAAVEGPSGGAFQFWEKNAVVPTISVPSGGTSTNFFVLSENADAPDSDPFGHIHNRRFTATKPGIYTVSFRAFDLSTNGANGGPIHTPSDILKMYFQAGINITSVTRNSGSADVTIGTAAKQTFYLESNNDLSSTNWLTIGSVAGNDSLQTITDFSATNAIGFYRVRVTTP